jgi:FkbM family methyltransferase
MRLHPFFLIDHHIIARGTYDAPLHRYLQANVHAGMTVFDVGANIGSVALHLSQRVGPTGRVICFEPVPYILDRLQENIAGNAFARNVQVEPVGVWRISGSMEIDIPNAQFANHGCASFFRRAVDSTRSTIKVVSLDDYVETQRIDRVDLIKFDIQGAETAALQGATKTLQRFRPIMLTEVSASDLQAHGVTSAEYLSQIEQLGYTCFGMKSDGSAGDLLRSECITVNAHYANVICLPRETKNFA